MSPDIFQDVYCSYNMFLDDEDVVTGKMSLTSNPDFNHNKLFSFPTVTHQVGHHVRPLADPDLLRNAVSLQPARIFSTCRSWSI